MKKYKKIFIRLLSFLILTIIIVIVIPSIMNKGLYWTIETHDSTDGDWLGFWGSFLGGVLGGIGTLVGVILTIKKSDSDRIEERRPRLIPIKKRFSIVREDENVYILDELSGISKKSLISDILELKVVNASKESAIDINMGWIPLKKENIFSLNSLSKSEQAIFTNVLKKFGFNDKMETEEEFVRGLDEVQISIHSHLNMFIEEIVKKFIHNYKIINNGKIYLRYDIPLGILYFNYKNIYGEDIDKNNKYIITITILDAGVTAKELYLGTLNFRLIKE